MKDAGDNIHCELNPHSADNRGTWRFRPEPTTRLLSELSLYSLHQTELVSAQGSSQPQHPSLYCQGPRPWKYKAPTKVCHGQGRPPCKYLQGVLSTSLLLVKLGLNNMFRVDNFEHSTNMLHGGHCMDPWQTHNSNCISSLATPPWKPFTSKGCRGNKSPPQAPHTELLPLSS